MEQAVRFFVACAQTLGFGLIHGAAVGSERDAIIPARSFAA